MSRRAASRCGIDGENIDIDLYVIVEYGTRITIGGRERGEHRPVSRGEGIGHASA